MISLITVNYNNPEVTEALLKSLSVLDLTEVEVIVVDNGSSKLPQIPMSESYPWAKFIRSEINLGFAGGNNLGIQHASGEYLFFINNDTEVRTNIILNLADTLRKNPTVGVVSPLICYYDDPQDIQYAGYTKINKLTGRNRCITEIPKNATLNLIETSYAHGAAMMMPRTVLDKVGVMPENFFLYYEEMDWCEKIRKAGYDIVVDPTSYIYHKESRTTGSINELKSYFMARNRILFMRRGSSPLFRLFFWIYYLAIATPLQLIRYSLKNQKHNMAAHLAGVGWNFRFPANSRTLGYKFNYLNDHA
jgi:GT2 family glycosyltransferase